MKVDLHLTRHGDGWSALNLLGDAQGPTDGNLYCGIPRQPRAEGTPPPPSCLSSATKLAFGHLTVILFLGKNTAIAKWKKPKIVNKAKLKRVTGGELSHAD